MVGYVVRVPYSADAVPVSGITRFRRHGEDASIRQQFSAFRTTSAPHVSGRDPRKVESVQGICFCSSPLARVPCIRIGAPRWALFLSGANQGYRPQLWVGRSVCAVLGAKTVYEPCFRFGRLCL